MSAAGTRGHRRRVRDLSNGRVGEVMDQNRDGTVLNLRPIGGGLEWDARVGDVQDLDPAPAEAAAR